MQKKITIWTYAKRALLILIAAVVVIFVSIYFLDVYKVSANINDFNNEYEDSYWENLEENGFISFQDIKTDRDSSQLSYSSKTGTYSPSATYILPYEDGADDVTKLKSARFDVELNYIYDEKIDAANKTAEIKELYEELKTKLNGYTRTKYVNDTVNNRLVLSNDKYDMYMNLYTSQFTLNQKDSEGNVIESWSSNPSEVDSAEGINKYQKAILTVTCVDGNKASTKTPIKYNSFTNGSEERTGLFIEPSFYVNVVEGTETEEAKVIVYYKLSQKGIDSTYIPKKITEKRMKELIARGNELVKQYKTENDGQYNVDSNGLPITEIAYSSAINGICPETGQPYSDKTKSFYNLVIDQSFKIVEKDANNNDLSEDERYFELKTTSDTAINACYRFLYEWCGYTEEDYLLDVGTEKQENSKARIDVAIEYKLGENGLEVMVPGNSIKTNTNEKGDYFMVTNMDVLQYFTSSRNFTNIKKNEKGYLVIPDGSGAVMEFNNAKANYSAYSKRIYTADLTFTSYTLTADTSDILLPMYAYVYQGPVVEPEDPSKSTIHPRAMVVEALEGAAQVSLNADTSNRGKNSFNYAYYSITFRESQKIVIGTNQYNRNKTTQYTVDGAFGDYRFAYMPLDLTKYDCSYNGVAKFYRDLIVSRSEGRLDVNGDKTTTSTLDLEVLGAYSYHTNFLGIGYTGKETLTTVDELQIIIDEITKLGINNINVYYKGWRNTGLVNTSFEKIKVSGLIGGKKALLKAINEYNDNIKIYPYVEFLEYEDFQESFGKSHYTARDVGGEYATKYPYELHSNVFNKKMKQIKVLSPAYYEAFSNELSKNYQKVLGINTIALSGLGSSLSGDYRRKQNVFKFTAVNEQIKAFLALEETGVDTLAIETPYAYALEFASNAYNVPYDSTKYEILDYNVPFYQLVINGLFDYSGESINENVEKGLNEHIMKCLETGSNPAFTFTYDDSSELLQTDYNNYYYTLYSRWLGDVEAVCDELNSLGIYNARLVSHERIENDVYKVVYETLDGSGNIEILLNYRRTVWSNGTYSVPAKSYQVVE